MSCNTYSKRGKTLPIEANQFTNRGLQAWPRTLFLSRKIRADPKVLKAAGFDSGQYHRGQNTIFCAFVILGRDYSGQSLPKNTIYDTIAVKECIICTP